MQPRLAVAPWGFWTVWGPEDVTSMASGVGGREGRDRDHNPPNKNQRSQSVVHMVALTLPPCSARFPVELLLTVWNSLFFARFLL